MATVDRPLNAVLAPRGDAAVVVGRRAPARTMRLLAVAESAARRQAIRAAAEAEAWDAIVCRDAGEFLRTTAKHRAPLLIVDLPPSHAENYQALRDAATRARHLQRQSLFMVTGVEGGREEVWARSLGAWAYFCGVENETGYAAALGDARLAVDRLIASEFTRRPEATIR